MPDWFALSGCCRFDQSHPAATALPVPFVPGALLPLPLTSPPPTQTPPFADHAPCASLHASLCGCRFDQNHPAPTAIPVPFVPGALLLQGVLSPAECKQIISAAEAIGWHSDVDYTFGGAAGDDGCRQQQQQHAPETPPQQQQQGASAPAASDAAGASAGAGARAAAATAANTEAASDAAAAAAAEAKAGSAARGLAAGLAGLPEGTPAAGCVWLADESVLKPLYDRVAQLLPQQIEGGVYAGINARWRLYRYT